MENKIEIGSHVICDYGDKVYYAIIDSDVELSKSGKEIIWVLPKMGQQDKSGKVLDGLRAFAEAHKVKIDGEYYREKNLEILLLNE